MPKRAKSRREIRERRYRSIRETVAKAISWARNYANTLKRTISSRRKAEEDRHRRRLEQKKRALRQLLRRMRAPATAWIQLESQFRAAVDIHYHVVHADKLPELMQQLATLSVNSMQGLPPQLADNGLLKAFARHYYAPANDGDRHSTMCAIVITPLTKRYLEGQPADFFIVSSVQLKQLTSPLVGITNTLYALFRYLLELLRRKGKREHFRKKRKGHFGVISDDEPVHTAYTAMLEERKPMKLSHIVNCSYCLKKAEAVSCGKPEIAFRIGEVNVMAVVGRKTKTTRRVSRKMDAYQRYLRMQNIFRRA